VSSQPVPADEEGDITSRRRETKYLFPVDRVDDFVRTLSEHVPRYRFTGDGANQLPGAHHYITTIYFDTPSGKHFRAASGGAGSVKVRAREYYDVHPSLAEVATSAKDIVRYDPWLWFELKRRDAGHSEKRRFCLRKRDVPAFFARASAPTPSHAATPRSPLPELEAILAYLRELEEPLSATCLVNYRRVSWQRLDAALRITLDLGLAGYLPRADLFMRERPLERSELGRPLFLLNDAVVEVKARCEHPAWLDAAIRRACVAPVEFSKFVQATRALQTHA
jgi:hypothetical protein